MNERLAFVRDHLDLNLLLGPGHKGLESYQILFLNSDDPLDITLKSRQIGFSFVSAIDAVAHAMLNPSATCLFISINRDEAGNKIRYANMVYDSLRPSVRLDRVTNNRHEIAFTNGSRILSFPAKAPRGFSQGRIYLDELAFIENSYLIYEGLVPVITRGGTIRAGSTPSGASGLFFDMWSNAGNRYASYKRYLIPWYLSRALCKDVSMAQSTAHAMNTADHVYKYGTDQLHMIYQNTTVETFQQEYCCYFQDHTTSWITETEIRYAQELDLRGELRYVQLEMTEDTEMWEVDEMIDQLFEWQKMNAVHFPLYGAMDLGRNYHGSEIIFGFEDNGLLKVAFHLTMRDMRFASQEAVVERLLNRLPVISFQFDGTGIGMDMAERLLEKFSWIEPVNFDWKTKQDLAVRAKVMFQDRRLAIPADENWYSQIHDLARRMRSNSSVSFVTLKNKKKHHNDIFWTLAMVCSAFFDPNAIQMATSPTSSYRG